MKPIEEVITDEDVEIINAARTVLNTIASRLRNEFTHLENGQDMFSRGKLHEIAENAQDSLFQVLNTAGSWNDLSLTDEQMFNREYSEEEGGNAETTQSVLPDTD